MTDHYLVAMAQMETASVLKDSLEAEYKHRPQDPVAVRLRSVTIARLHDDLRHTLTMAKLHANLADVQATHDLRSVVEQLAKDLNEPTEFVEVERHAAPVVRLVEDTES